MTYLLDTNAVIALLNREPRLVQRARQEAPALVAVSAIVTHELFYGAFRSRRPTENAATIDGLPLTVLEFDKEDSRAAGRVRAQLAAEGTPIGPYDVLIAGQAIARGLTLVTHNLREFMRVRDLRCEDWQG